MKLTKKNILGLALSIFLFNGIFANANEFPDDYPYDDVYTHEHGQNRNPVATFIFTVAGTVAGNLITDAIRNHNNSSSCDCGSERDNDSSNNSSYSHDSFWDSDSSPF